jgi:DNA-binding beta-propeller fold protein YncE
MWLAANSSTVKEYTAPLSSSSAPALSFTSGVQTASGIAFDPSGNIYVGNRGSRTITAYVPGNAATPFETISVTGRPEGIAITP